ncbi:opacity family porin [Breoghania sp.]|uniref:outer membrane protein n=1 Tax=Breoghania sp. TaxID=2065378 RepID=UPI002603C499|nr:opacity family porin [Breoghania sp.]MDJ0931947.1 outer membrane beta-barrel protein [Breoghania sp.]
MVNAYADLGTIYDFTSYVKASGIRYDNGGGNTGSYGSHGRWNLAWALMAGASYEISPNMMVDAGYQFRSLGKAKSGRIDGTQSRIEYDDLYVHELRLGLLYNFN